jgi:hypothetical protein
MMLTVTLLPTVTLKETIQGYIDRLTQSALNGQCADACAVAHNRHDEHGRLRCPDPFARCDAMAGSGVTLNESLALELLRLAGPRLVDGSHGPALAVWPEHRGFPLIAVLRFFGLDELELRDREN